MDCISLARTPRSSTVQVLLSSHPAVAVTWSDAACFVSSVLTHTAGIPAILQSIFLTYTICQLTSHKLPRYHQSLFTVLT